MLPLITLTQIGVIVGFGVLLDTLLVRSILVPAIVALLGRRFWWPGSLSRHARPLAGPAGVDVERAGGVQAGARGSRGS
nr:MMPL family transporter [Nocardioides ungokensis]